MDKKVSLPFVVKLRILLSATILHIGNRLIDVASKVKP